MVFENAPVTGLLLALSVLSTSTISRHYTVLQPSQAVRGWWLTLRYLPLNTLPFGSVGLFLTDVMCTLLLLFQMRTLERRWGSSSFLSFFVTTAFAGSVLLNILVTEATPPLALEQMRLLSAGGSIVPLAALAVRHLFEVPTLYQWRIPIISVMFTGKLMIFLPFLRLLFFPGTEIFQRSHRQRVIQVDIGLWVRLVLTLCGVILGVASTRSRILVWWLGLFSRNVCRPLINVAQPVLSALFGPTKSMLFAVPPQKTTGQTLAGGRYAVENIAGFRENMGLQQQHGGPSFQWARHAGQQRQLHDVFPEHNNSSAAGDTAVTEEKIARIMELGLGFDEGAIRNALTAANGHVDAAVEILVNRL